MIHRRLRPRVVLQVLGVALVVLPATGCKPTPDVPHGDTGPARKDRLMPPEIQCSTAPGDDGRVVVRYQVHNAGSQTLYLLDGKHMPYQIVAADGTLQILHGVNPPDPDKLYNLIEIPLTRLLGPGESFAGEAALPVKMLRDHYGERPAPAGLLHGTIRVRCEVGWGTTAITAAERNRMSIQQLLAWQQLVDSGPFDVVLP